MFEQHARAGFRRLRAHQFRGGPPQFAHAGQCGGAEHTDDEQHDAGRAGHPIVFEPNVRNHVHVPQHQHQEGRYAEESGEQAGSAAEQAGERREQQVARGDGDAAVAESGVGADESAFLFDHARHRGEAHEHRDGEEHDGECQADGFDGAHVGVERAVSADAVA